MFCLQIPALQLALLQQGSGSGLANGLQNGTGSQPSLHDMHISGSLEDLKSSTQRRSQNMTECVPVPSSEHVAEIVGRQGKECLKKPVKTGCKMEYSQVFEGGFDIRFRLILDLVLKPT